MASKVVMGLYSLTIYWLIVLGNAQVIHKRNPQNTLPSTATASTESSPPASSTVTASSPPTATATGGGEGRTGGGGGGGPTNSPLLFFVALGFGVVFTNLWIIVGVKYCFRYNQRQRARRAEAAGEPIDMGQVRRPGRRRREKKLMTMEEVNERFPLTKYKAWRATRERKGLSTAGGVIAPSSRPVSMHGGKLSLEGNRSVPLATENDVAQSSQEQSSSGPAGQPNLNGVDIEKGTLNVHHPDAEPQAAGSSGQDEEDDDHIETAVAPELLAEPGDSCAICLDALDDDDEVRGLSCGHAFHAGCIDPWLTSRRACCPLCKADYYVPKPRLDGDVGSEATRTGRRSAGMGRNRAGLPRVPQSTWPGSRRGNPFRPRMGVPRSHLHDHYEYPVMDAARRRQRGAPSSTTATDGWSSPGPRPWRPRIPLPFGRGRDAAQDMAANATSANQAHATTPPGPGTASGNWRTRFTTRIRALPSFKLRSRSETPQSSDPTQDGAQPGPATAVPTPGQLESGPRL